MEEKLINEVTTKVIQEYLGVSDDVMEVSEEIYSLMMRQLNFEFEYANKYNESIWKHSDVYLQNGEEVMTMRMWLDINESKASEFLNSVFIRLYGYNPNKYDFFSYYKLLAEKGLVKMAYAPNSEKISLMIPYPLVGELEPNIQHYLITCINHEVKHAFQSKRRNGANVSDAYANSLKNTNFDADEKNTIILMRAYIKNCFYVFDKDEIDARLQEIYLDLTHYYAIEKSPAFLRFVEAMNNYSRLMKVLTKDKNSFDYKYYEEERKRFQEILTNELGDGITIQHFIRYCERGIKYFKEHLRHIIGRYNQENNINYGSFKQYAANEIPQEDIFKYKEIMRKNPSLWKKLLNRLKKR
jgi:hypothetical protein